VIAFLLAILPIAAKVLGNGVLESIMGWAKNKDDTKARILEAELGFYIEQNKARAQVLVADTQHWLMWLPRFLLYLPVSMWVAAVFIDSTFDFSWTVLDVPANFWHIVYSVVGLFTLDTVSRNFKR